MVNRAIPAVVPVSSGLPSGEDSGQGLNERTAEAVLVPAAQVLLAISRGSLRSGRSQVPFR
jgi:hypothetical protein